ncbi:hypothetical protein AB0H73_06310 [Streptomyces olivoreticuli]
MTADDIVEQKFWSMYRSVRYRNPVLCQTKAAYDFWYHGQWQPMWMPFRRTDWVFWYSPSAGRVSSAKLWMREKALREMRELRLDGLRHHSWVFRDRRGGLCWVAFFYVYGKLCEIVEYQYSEGEYNGPEFAPDEYVRSIN